MKRFDLNDYEAEDIEYVFAAKGVLEYDIPQKAFGLPIGRSEVHSRGTVLFDGSIVRFIPGREFEGYIFDLSDISLIREPIDDDLNFKVLGETEAKGFEFEHMQQTEEYRSLRSFSTEKEAAIQLYEALKEAGAQS